MLKISGLTDLERDVLLEMLAAHPDQEPILRDQLDHARITSRELTGVGFFLYLSTNSRRAFPADGEINRVFAKLPGLTLEVSFLLFIRDGKLGWLEGKTYAEPWPEQPQNYHIYQARPNTNYH